VILAVVMRRARDGVLGYSVLPSPHCGRFLHTQALGLVAVFGLISLGSGLIAKAQMVA
jgi:hypothetical protein